MMFRILDPLALATAGITCILSVMEAAQQPSVMQQSTALLYALAAFLTAVGSAAYFTVRIAHIVQHMKQGRRMDDPETPPVEQATPSQTQRRSL